MVLTLSRQQSPWYPFSCHFLKFFYFLETKNLGIDTVGPSCLVPGIMFGDSGVPIVLNRKNRVLCNVMFALLVWLICLLLNISLSEMSNIAAGRKTNKTFIGNRDTCVPIVQHELLTNGQTAPSTTIVW